MAKYSFPQFRVEIENPTIEINYTNITDNTIDKKLSVSVTLVTDSAKFGIRLTDIQYSETWSDSDISDLVSVRLSDFEI